MRDITATLEAAQKTLSAPPAVRIKLDDRHCGAPRYHFTNVRVDATLDNNHCAAVNWGNYLGILTVDASNVPTFYRYTAGAAPGAPLVVSLGGEAGANTQLALIYEGTTLWAFCISSDSQHLCYTTSADNGATWAAWVEIDHTISQTFQSLAVAKGSGTKCTWVLFCGANLAGTTKVWVYYLVAGTIYGNFAWPRHDATAIRGLAASFASGSANWTTVQLYVAGLTENRTYETISAYTLQVYPDYTHPRTWLYLGTLIQGSSPGFVWSWPAVTEIPADRTYVIAQETSPSTAVYPVLIPIRPTTLFQSTAATPRRPLPAQGTSTLALASATTGLIYGTPKLIYHAPCYTTASRVDLSANLIHYHFTEALPPYTEPSMATFIFGSEANYLALPTNLYPGAQLMLEEGYINSAGTAEYSPLPPFYIHSVSRTPHQITVQAYDTWGKLMRQPADFSTTYSDSPHNIFSLLSHLIGVPYSDDDTTFLNVSLTPPTFSISYGQPLAALATRLLLYTACIMTFEATTPDTYPSVSMYVASPPNTTAGAYQFSPTTHPVLDWTMDDADTLASWITTTCEDVYAERFDLTQVDRLGFASQLAHDDPNWNPDSDISPDTAARITLAFYQHRRYDATITTRPNVGAIPGDIIHVTADPITGYRRILAITHNFDRTRAVYPHTYHLAAYANLGQ